MLETLGKGMKKERKEKRYKIICACAFAYKIRPGLSYSQLYVHSSYKCLYTFYIVITTLQKSQSPFPIFRYSSQK